MRARTRHLQIALVVVCLTLAASPASGGGVGISTPPEDPQAGFGCCIEKLFHVYRPRPTQIGFAKRDLEFMWSDSFRVAVGGTDGLPYNIRRTLDALGENIAEVPSNPLGIPAADVRLVYDYFRLQPPGYNPNPFDPTGFIIGPNGPCSSGTIPSWELPTADRSHVDTYLFVNNEMRQGGGSYSSVFWTWKEDSTTGHLANVVSNPTTQQRDTLNCAHTNSLMYQGPPPASAVDTTGAGWAAADSTANWGFCHEFQHSFPPQMSDDNMKLGITELFSTGAEALAGERPDPPIFEVPYTWPLIGDFIAEGGGCAGTFRYSANYQAWRLFSAYLVYNFRGQDTTQTLAAIEDDLMHRWARNDRRLSGLRPLLRDDSCYTCSQKTYFHPGGAALDDISRLALLLHNWRTATYVNNSSLAEGQYGYPPQFGFQPARDVGAWQSFDACGLQDDVVAIPPEVTMTPTHITQEVTKVVTRYTSNGQYSYPMRLWPEGSEYWVVRSDPALATTAQDLLVSVAAESVIREIQASGQRDGRLVASVVPYAEQGGNLWEHPEWARAPLQPKWVDVDSAAGSLQLVVPHFGDSIKAAVVVISLADGPGQYWSGLTRIPNFGPTLPYRVTFALRKAPADTLTPKALTQTPNAADDSPTWSPAGDEVAFSARLPGYVYYRIWRQKLDGTPPTAMVSLPQSRNMYRPDWSPRGDFVAFEQDSGASHSDLWLVAPSTGVANRATCRPGWATWPAFQPNGERLAYVHQVGQTWELRRMDLYGSSGDIVLVGPVGAEIRSPRWTVDGKSIYFTKNDTLYAVGSNGGAVYNKAALLGGALASTVDLHRGSGRLLLEQPGVYKWKNGFQTLDMPYRRLALRDTLANNTQARFYQTGVSFYNPRWSYNGTRVAYSADPNQSGDREVFVGQVSYNHPPVFVGLENDQFPEACSGPFFLDLNAPDPDGETVTYAATYLPPGSSLSGNRFTWLHPQVGEYRVVFRALDGSGGLDYRVVYFNVVDTGNCLEGGFAGGGEGGGGSALAPEAEGTAAAATGGENSLFEGAPAGEPTWDALRVPSPTLAGAYRAWVRTGSARAASLDALRLLVVDHDPALVPCLLGRGVVLGRRVAATGARLEDGTDVTASLSGTATKPLRIGASSTLTLTLPNSAGPLLVEARRLGVTDRPEDSGILVQIPDGTGWRTVAQLFPRVGFDAATVDCGGASAVRLVFMADAELRFAGRLVRSTETATVRWADLQSARDAKLGDVKGAVSSPDGATAAFSGPDTVSAEFTLPPLAAGQSRDCFLWVEATLQAARGAAAGHAQPAPTPLPTAFALFQNQPNPFEARTAIRFALPRECAVRLEVFDLLGRRLQVLADRSFPAGYHAVDWDRRDRDGNRVRPGLYLCRIQAGEFRDRKRMVVLP